MGGKEVRMKLWAEFNRLEITGINIQSYFYVLKPRCNSAKWEKIRTICKEDIERHFEYKLVK